MKTQAQGINLIEGHVNEMYLCFEKYISKDISKLESCLLRTEQDLYVDVAGLESLFPNVTFFFMKLVPGSLSFNGKCLVPIEYFSRKYFEKGLHQIPTEHKKPFFTYVCIDHNTGLYKIGKSRSPSFREKTLQSEKPSIEMIMTMDSDYEKTLHAKYSAKRVRGEWFRLDEEDVRQIKTMVQLKMIR